MASPSTTSLFTENASDEPASKKGKTKGKAAIITSDGCQENLMAEKIKNIKKEKDEKEKKTRKRAVKNEKPQVEPRKRKQLPAASTVPSKIRKPLQLLNQDQLEDQLRLMEPISDSPELIPANDLTLLQNENYLREAIPESSILNTESAVINGQSYQIFYVDENVAKSLNLQLA